MLGGTAGKLGGGKLGRAGANGGGNLPAAGGGEERNVTGGSAPAVGRILTGLDCTGTEGGGGMAPGGRGLLPAPGPLRLIGGIWMRAVFLAT